MEDHGVGLDVEVANIFGAFEQVVCVIELRAAVKAHDST